MDLSWKVSNTAVGNKDDEVGFDTDVNEKFPSREFHCPRNVATGVPGSAALRL